MRTVVAIVVKDGLVVSYATNEHSPCLREGYPTGQGYELCEGCDYPNHAEVEAVKGQNGGVLYLIGHTYACEPCKKACKESNVEIKII